MTISICILTHNEESNIDRCLLSLLKQGNDFSTILVIDNYSSDKTKEKIYCLLNKHPDYSIHFISLKKNNLGYARSLAFKFLKTSWIAFIDADCEMPEKWLEKTTDLLLKIDENKKIAAIGGPNIFLRGHSLFSVARADMQNLWISHFGAPQMTISSGSKEVEHLPTANVIYRRNDVLEVGNFSDQFHEVCEDLDVSLKLRDAEKKLIYFEDIGVFHHQLDTWMSWAKRMFRYGHGQSLARGLNIFRWPARLLFAISLMFAFCSGLFSIVLLYILGMSAVIYLNKNRKSTTLILLFLVSITHFFYGMGLLFGLFKAIFSKYKKTDSQFVSYFVSN